ncbi:MAG: sigma 54-interacting transcriptional regulator [Desulfitobacteriaceae bacterium]|nr:sigma 54-interacting transcriptional regulator [Desulfitobacteriaceae bacterium]
MIVSSSAMTKVIDIVNKVAMVDSNVLIQGESGVGKGMIAKQIHKLSGRHNGPFITIDCGAIPETLIESELFGYEGGAFTGAKKEGKKGLIELGNGGTVFFDEIGELPINLQVKLLRVIQEKRLMRIGGNRSLDINIRVLAATNRDLAELIKLRKFREDLYYRLNVVPILVPPLHNRIEEIKMLTNYFTSKINERYGFHKQFSPETINILEKYHWPGNVRELENLVERLLVITDANEILPKHLPEFLFQTASASAKKVTVWDICSLKEATDEVEKQLLRKVQEKCKNTYQMAEVLKVNQSTIVRKLHKYGLLKNNYT